MRKRTADTVKTSDNRVSVSMMPAGGSEAVTYTSAMVYGTSNAMTGSNIAGVITGRRKKGAFIEICLNAAGDVIDMRRVLQAGLNFDTAKYGGDLTEIGSAVSLRGGQYTDIYNKDAAGATSVYTGDSGAMVAYGWLLEKGTSTITVGDGNLMTEAFNEAYNVANDVKVYQVDNYIKTVNESGTFASTPSDFDSLTPSTLTDGTIYQTPSAGRYQVVVIFDKDYTQYNDAKVVEIYEYRVHRPRKRRQVCGQAPPECACRQ